MRLSFYRRRLKISPPFVPAKAGTQPLAWIPAFAGMNGALCATEQITHVPAGFPGHWELALLQDAALAGPPRRAFRAHSSVGRAADS